MALNPLSDAPEAECDRTENRRPEERATSYKLEFSLALRVFDDTQF